ncbi:hypothetical protein H257_15925 [Aphanomyces astaci]|uniref:G domain-containing protein n=1 Tax=Aphanomyces astaci TaxID=112090 RepID=W4FM13_APHAT|nr:hypothetical protein H257_15925 [Aphanomyces astaci]ETV67941.1 hypothetical protein H257_15925 [Aphanomyces astaci]|eukprot:XP_009842505.1 hypothetical protein H257_15925 [Aphanomyces astaci]
MGNVVEPVHPSGGATMSCRGSSSSFTIAPKAKRHPAAITTGHILFVGLDGSGKTNLVQGLANMCTPTTPIDKDQHVWATSNPLPSRFPVIKSVQLNRREVNLLAVPGSRDLRYLWYTSLTRDEISAICFCVDISDTIRFPLVALELQRLHEFQHSNNLATSWLLFTKSDCIQVKKGTAVDTYERLKTICTQLKKEPCNWGFTVMPLVNSNLEGSLLDVKNWIQETLPPKP